MKDLIVEEFIKTFIRFLPNTIDNAVQLMGNGINNYIGKFYNELSYTTSFLHRVEPVHIDEIYYPINIALENGNDKIIKLDSIIDLFSISKLITIRGEAGSGKSTALKFLFNDCLKKSYSIPVYLKLRECQNSNFEQYVLDKLVQYELAQNHTIAVKLIKCETFVFMLDGFDEVKSEIKNDIIRSINEFVEKYYMNRFIITSRLNTNIDSLSSFFNFTVLKLEIDDVKKFVIKLVKNTEQRDSILKSIEDQMTEHVINYLGNPLLLSLYITSYKAFSKIPIKSTLFYRRVIDVLFTEHDSLSKIGYERELASKLSQLQIEQILEQFSFITYFKDMFEFNLRETSQVFDKIKIMAPYFKFDTESIVDDLTIAIGLWVKDGSLYSFTHRSLQEYFAALQLSNMNTEKKSKFLTSLFEKHVNGDYEEINTFLSLYREIDEEFFYKYYAIPLYESHLESFAKSSRKEKLIESVKMIVDELVLYKDEELTGWGYSGGKMLMILHHKIPYRITYFRLISSLARSINRICIINPELIEESIEYNIDSELAEPSITNKSYKVKLDLLLSCYIHLLFDSEFEQLINKFIEEIKEYYNYIQTRMAQINKENDSIIDLVM